MGNNHLSGRILPAELLLIVFEYCAGFDSAVSLAWTRVLLVCRFWCNIGTNNSKLWTKIIPTRGIKGATELLRRSGTQPLDVHVPLVGPETLEILRLLLTQAGRVRTLSLHVPYEYHAELAHEVSLTNGFPQLKALILYATTELDDARIQLNNIFPHELPRLVDLDIRAEVDVGGMLDAPALEQLTVSHAWSDEPAEAWYLEASDFASAICRMPRLRELTVQNMRLEGTMPTKSVAVPALRLLTLEGPAIDVANLCDMLVVPHAASIALDVVLEDEEDANHIVFQASQLFIHRDSRTKRMLRSLTVSNGASGYDFVIEGSTTYADFLEPTEALHEYPTDFSLVISATEEFHNDNEEANMEDLAQFVDLIPLEGVHALNVIGSAAKDFLIPVSFREIVDDLAGLALEGRVHVDNFQAAQAVGANAALWQEKIPSLRKIQWSPLSRDDYME
ncbi:F-box protein [Phanerochaete sordida]|uniref:F-box protein n=1 Tax=Phanerochaete sordida TaxID=48140 RepID=A0A9P3GGC3_9APHY|nr:F-box protein [Phanerochaete sordida]